MCSSYGGAGILASIVRRVWYGMYIPTCPLVFLPSVAYSDIGFAGKGGVLQDLNYKEAVLWMAYNFPVHMVVMRMVVVRLLGWRARTVLRCMGCELNGRR